MNRGKRVRLLLRLALRQVAARKGLSAVAAGGVMLGVLTLVVTSALLWGAKLQFESVILDVSPEVSLEDREFVDTRSVFERGGEGPMAVESRHSSPLTREGRIAAPDEVMRELRAMPGVLAAAPGLAATALLSWGSATRPVDVRGIELDLEETVKPISRQVIRGSVEPLRSSAQAIVIGRGLAKELGLDVGDAVRLLGPSGIRREFEVAGVFESRVSAIDDRRCYVALRAAQELTGSPAVVRRIELRLRDPSEATAVAREVERRFGYRAESWQEANASFIALLAVQRRMGSVILGAIVLLSSFGILAVQIMVVNQKRRDIAILRAVGFHARDVRAIFLVYGLVLATAGGAAGALLAKLVVLWLASLRVDLEGVTRGDRIFIADVPAVYLAGFGFAVLAGVLASVIPAIRASRVEPVAVLRDQIA
jgi:lipoprotein-releasing system permease protein